MTVLILAPDLEGASFFGLCSGPQQNHRDNRQGCERCRGEKAKQVPAAEEGLPRIRSRRRVPAHWDLTGLPGHVLPARFQVGLRAAASVRFALSGEVLVGEDFLSQDFLCVELLSSRLLK